MPGWSNHLVAYLREQSATSVALTFAELQQLVGQRLPPTAQTRAYWISEARLKQKLVGIGWRVSGYDRHTRTITFSRCAMPES